MTEIFIHDNCGGELRMEFDTIPIIKCLKCKTSWDLNDNEKFYSYKDLKIIEEPK